MRKVDREILDSSLMQRKLSYRVILPADYQNSRKTYPVLFLLHGLFGCCDNWLELTNISGDTQGKDFIIVLPEGSDSWYSDSATIEKDKFESSFIEEFIPEIDEKYRTIKHRNGRAIAGLSMGGFGALKFALKRPELFVFAGSLSGAFEAPLQSESNPGFDWDNLSPSILKTFGEKNNPARNRNDLFKIIESKDTKEIFSLPYLYINCGTEDGFLKVNRNLVELLEKKSIKFEYHEVSGGHDWAYWDKQIKPILKIADEKFKSEKEQI